MQREWSSPFSLVEDWPRKVRENCRKTAFWRGALKGLTFEERVKEILKENFPEKSEKDLKEVVSSLLSEFEREFARRSIPLVERIAKKTIHQ